MARPCGVPWPSRPCRVTGGTPVARSCASLQAGRAAARPPPSCSLSFLFLLLTIVPLWYIVDGHWIAGRVMSLRKSPTLTPALLASNRRNAAKSTGPRAPRGKAKSRLNRLRHGRRSPEFLALWNALLEAPPGQVAATARTLLASHPMQHPLILDTLAMSMRVERERCARSASGSAPRKNRKRILFFDVQSRNDNENKGSASLVNSRTRITY